MRVKNLKDFHRVVCERDHYICQGCGKDYSDEYYFQEDNNGRVNQFVCGHHILTRGSHPELRFETDIGVCLDVGCHLKVHNGELKLKNLE